MKHATSPCNSALIGFVPAQRTLYQRWQLFVGALTSTFRGDSRTTAPLHRCMSFTFSLTVNLQTARRMFYESGESVNDVLIMKVGRSTHCLLCLATASATSYSSFARNSPTAALNSSG